MRQVRMQLPPELLHKLPHWTSNVGDQRIPQARHIRGKLYPASAVSIEEEVQACRAGVLARWASLLLAYGTTSALALSVLPESFSRPFAVPTGVALIGLGLSLWRDQRRQAHTAGAPATTWAAQPVTRSAPGAELAPTALS